MQNVTLPLWMLIVIVGVPVLFGFFLSAGLLRRKRHGRALMASMGSMPAPAIAPEFGRQVARQLMEQQIDAVFNTLANVIETERRQLKALIEPIPPATAAATAAAPSPAPASARIETVPAENHPISQRISDMAARGLRSEEIARLLDLSGTEVELGIRLHQGAAARQQRKLEAVA